MKTSDQIETERMDVLRKKNEKREELNTVSIRVHELKKQREAIDSEIEALNEAKRKARHTLSVLETQNEILKSEYWQTRG